jgi:outer membrane protein assembly factor BamA
MRGYIEGRFRDRASWLASAEYRFWFIPRGFPVPLTKTIRIERVGAALFYDVGSVAPTTSRMFQTRVRHSYGFGFRLLLERTAPFRLDVGFSEEGGYVAAGFGFTF